MQNHIRLLGRTNKVYKSYIGLEYHPTIVPPAIQRNILKSRLVHYTPYQAEIAQGRLEAILNFKQWYRVNRNGNRKCFITR
jgi:glycine dehydrogenase